MNQKSRGVGETHARVAVIEDGVIRTDEHVTQDPKRTHGRRHVEAHEAADALRLALTGVDFQHVLFRREGEFFPAEHEFHRGHARQSAAVHRGFTSARRYQIAQALHLVQDFDASGVLGEHRLRVRHGELTRVARKVTANALGLKRDSYSVLLRQQSTRRRHRRLSLGGGGGGGVDLMIITGIGRRGGAESDRGTHLRWGEGREVVDEIGTVLVNHDATLLAQDGFGANLFVDGLNHAGGTRKQRRSRVDYRGATLGAALTGGCTDNQGP